MKGKHLVSFFLAVLLEGIPIQIILANMSFDQGRGQIINYPVLRSILLWADSIILVVLLLFSIFIIWKVQISDRISSVLDDFLTGPKLRLFFVQGALLIFSLFLFECFLSTYLAFPVPLRPLFIWGTLICMDAWLFNRIAYARYYRERLSLGARLHKAWTALQLIQKKTFFIVGSISLMYFLAFIPSNAYRDSYGNFPTEQDEKVLYPDVVRAMAPQPDFGSYVDSFIEHWQWQYGYPYLTASAIVLLIPRLIFGDQFAAHLQLNIFLLRQFVSVLPMVLSIILAVYLVTRFRYLKQSVALLVFLFLIPGIVKYNRGYWHPDSLVILCTIATIYFLQKDDLRFGRHFYLAAVFCGLAIAIKLWGAFFIFAIAGYLLAGLIQKKLDMKRFFFSGFLFILVMLGTIIITSPSLMAPFIVKGALAVWPKQQNALLYGPDANTAGIYDTGLLNWLRYFGYNFMKSYFYFFSILALLLGSLRGSRKYLNRLLLAWSLPVTLFLAYFIAMKNFQYMLLAVIPLVCGASLFPTVMDNTPQINGSGFLKKPITWKISWGITMGMFASQFIINLVILFPHLFVVR